MEASDSKQPPWQFGGHRFCDRRDITVLIFSHDVARPPDQAALRLYGRMVLILYPQPAKFVSHRHCSSVYIIF